MNTFKLHIQTTKYITLYTHLFNAYITVLHTTNPHRSIWTHHTANKTTT